MPGCVLRVGSKTTKVEPLIKASGLRRITIHRKGQPRMPGGTWLSVTSSFNVEVSRSNAGIERQARDAIRFLRRHHQGLQRLRRCKNFNGMTLDFGLYDRRTDETPWPSYHVPARLVGLAGKHFIEIV